MKKKIFLIFMVFVMLLSVVAACGDGGTDATPDGATPPGEQTDDPGNDSQFKIPRNLGGVEIFIADWWTPSDGPPFKAKNLRDEQWLDHIAYLEQEHGFTVRRAEISGWGEYMEKVTSSIMADDPEADIFVMSGGWAMSLMKQGLLYPLNQLDSIDVYDARWNASITQMFTSDGDVFGITPVIYVEPRNFLFWNKRLFEEAGIDPHLPYDLQASGEWTWDSFWDLCEKLTQDTDGDGMTDRWALTGFDIEEVVPGFVYSNFGKFVGVNDDGEYYNATRDENFIEAAQFARRLFDGGHWATYPPDANWDWFVTAFVDGHAAMIIREAFSTDVWQHMDDDWGMVFVPMGPRADDYRTYFNENVFVVPANISREKAEDIMYAFNMYNEPLPYDLENPDFWKEDVRYGYQRFRDTRAVDETLAMFYDGRGVLKDKEYLPNMEWNQSFSWGFMNDSESPIERIEAAAPVIQAAIDAYYGR